MWKEFIDKYGSKDIRELLNHSDDMIHILDLIDEILIDEIKHYNNIILCGGGII